ncbi:DNA translocase FtsK, partial [Streptococcus anginosus]
MASKKNSKKGRTTRRPTKAEMERQKAIRRMLATFGIAFLLLFAALKWGAVGITLYNLIRLLVGSLAYMAIIASLIYLFFFKWVNKHEGYKSGFFSIFIGLLLMFQAYFVNVLNLKGQVLSTTLSRILTDLTAVKVSAFAGGGLLGATLYTPIAFLFSNIGTYFIGLLLILLGALLISPYSIYDIFEKLSETYHTWSEKREAKRQQRFIEKEEKAAQAAMNAIQVEQDEPQIDSETGEILDDEVLAHTPIQFEEAEPEIYDYDESLSEKQHKEEQQDNTDEDVEVNFTPKESLDYKLPTINLFAPDKPKNQSKEKKIVRENIKILEETFASFGIRASVERAEIGPSVTKYEVKPAVGVRVNRISNLADDLALALAAKDVRIEAPIPGKSLVGIEVPNSEIATVTFRELWEQSKT